MQALSLTQWRVAVLMALSVASLAFVACSSGTGRSSLTSPDHRIAPHSIEACLHRAGATIATSQRELQFLSQAESRDEVSKVGFVWDKIANVFVRIWQATTFEGHPPAWTIWFGQPFSNNGSPMEIVQGGTRNSYVAFVNHPSAQLRQLVDRCVRF